MTRGVLLDVARYRGVDALRPGEAIDAEDLEGRAARARVAVQAGDIVLVRTGDVGRRLRERSGTFSAGDAPGLSSDRPVAPREVHRGSRHRYLGRRGATQPAARGVQPLHLVMVVNMGLLVGEIFNLEPLADDCAADGVYEFMFVAPPLPITRAVGSPINPQAIK